MIPPSWFYADMKDPINLYNPVIRQHTDHPTEEWLELFILDKKLRQEDEQHEDRRRNKAHQIK